MHAVAGHPEHFRDRRRLLYFRHVAILAALFLFVVTVQPFRTRHLLRQLANHLRDRSSCLGEQGVAGGAQLRISDVRFIGRQKTIRRCLHDMLLALLDLKRPVLGMLVLDRGRVYDKPAVETLAGAEFFFSDLVAH